LKIAVASGKGGTGKTTIAVNLALSINKEVQLLDCDVEEPNCHIFMKPAFTHSESIGIPVPEVDLSRCNNCGECGRICQYSAIVAIGKKVLIFPELCHGCGGCSLVCPEGAVSEVNRELGVVEKGWSDGIEFIQGKLRISEAMAPPLIRAVKRNIDLNKTAIIDAPPGTSCPVIEAVKGSDFCILVTEPTPFGLNDLALAVGAVRILKIPFGVIVNQADIGDQGVSEYCRGESIPILMEIPNDRGIAEAYSRGKTIVEVKPEWKERFCALFDNIVKHRGIFVS
jgi:MinD superfamily P-loop ATPase